MTTYINTATLEYPLFEGDIRLAFRHSMSFPVEGFEPPDGYAVVQPSPPPEVDAGHSVTEAPPALIDGVWTQQWAVVECPAPVIAAKRQALVDSIDAACAAIYTRVGRFSEEYKEREAQAIAFKAAGYTGAVPRQVAAFSTPAGVTPTYATDLILSQAAQLRGALSALGELRMRKYELKNASLDAAVAAHAQILAAINAIGAAL